MMIDPAITLGVASAGIVLFLTPALVVFFGGIPSAGALRWTVAIWLGSFVLATAEWMLLGQLLAVAVYQGSIAAAAAAAVASVGLRVVGPRRMAGFIGAWVALVLVPLAFAVFDVQSGPIAATLGTLDYAGGSALGIVPGAAALAIAIARWRYPGRTEAPRRPAWLLALCSISGVVGFASVAVGAELMVDATTPGLLVNAVLAPTGGAIGWVVAQVANIHRATPAGVVAGILAGSVVVLPASPWFEPGAAVVLGIIAGILGHLATVAARSTPIDVWSTLVGVLLVPGVVGMVATGVVAAGPGLLYSGHIDLAESQLQGLAAVVLIALPGATALAALAFLRPRGRSGPSADDAVEKAGGQQPHR